MNYEFPLINNISDVLPAIEDHPEIKVSVKDGYTVINYQVIMADTFPTVAPAGGSAKMRAERSLHAKLRRECRGIIFDNETGDIIRRPFHKFFNVNERDETQESRIDLSRGHVILDKLDGSMIAPFIVNGKMIWGTKMGATEVAEPVEEFVKNNPQYVDLTHHLINYGDGWTPIFEWCSRKQRIVLDYAEDQLILTAIRNMKTGEYSSFRNVQKHGEEHNIPVVRAFEPQTDMKEFIEYTAGLENTEGFVVRFDDGHMIKLKSHWYVQIHKAKEAILQDRNIVQLILEEHLDDVKAHLSAEDRDRLTQFESDFNVAINNTINQILTDIVDISQRGIDRKTFAIEEAPRINGYQRLIIFALWDIDPIGQQEVRERVVNTIRNNLGKTTKYEEIRDAWFPGVVFNS